MRIGVLFTFFYLTVAKISFGQSVFEIQSIDKALELKMRSTGVFSDQSPVPIARLRLLKITHLGFDGKSHHGEIIVLDACSKQVLSIFKELYDRKFPMGKVSLLTEYKGSDSLSMADNNTSGHNFRQVTGGSSISLHAYGTAIDLNPIQNPFIEISCDGKGGIARYQPVASIKYANRMENRLGKENRKGMAEEVIDVFAKNGFYWWGGYWNCPIDYQHFQISRSLTELLAAMTPEDAEAFFEFTVAYFNKNKKPIEDALTAKIERGLSLTESYTRDPGKFRTIYKGL